MAGLAIDIGPKAEFLSIDRVSERAWPPGRSAGRRGSRGNLARAPRRDGRDGRSREEGTGHEPGGLLGMSNKMKKSLSYIISIWTVWGAGHKMLSIMNVTVRRA